MLLAPLLLFKRRLRTLRGRLKPACPHLGRGPRLLVQNIALQFLFGHGLTRPAKGTCADGLGPQPCARDIPLATNIPQRLLDCRVFETAHKR